MSANTNTVRYPQMYDCQENDPRRAGGKWEIDGDERRCDTQRTWLLQLFQSGGRDENGRRSRPHNQATEEQVAMLTQLYGIEFEKSEILPGHWYCNTPLKFKGWYSLM